LALTQLARGNAVLAGRDFVVPDDVRDVAAPALAHRISLKPETWVRRVTGADVITEVLRQVPTPATRSSR
jgi:MoxR-like ATPase